MKQSARRLFLKLYSGLYWLLARLIFLTSAQAAHHGLLGLLRRADDVPLLCGLAGLLHRAAFARLPARSGGVALDFPFIVAAGLVKGDGFADEAAALRAVAAGKNIMPGWRVLPRLAGAVEFGSFTRYPRTGNPGTVIWRDARSRSTQNRVGLKNPGAAAAARFLSAHRDHLPPVYGINLAVSPGLTDVIESARDVLGSLGLFLAHGLRPAWFTLNLSCPNTEDDPGGHQTEAYTRRLCKDINVYLQASGVDVPLWVKVSPLLSAQQYDILLRVCTETGVRAIIATNTLPMPAPGAPDLRAGVGGGGLHQEAMTAVVHLIMAKLRQGSPVDIIGCGGLLDGQSYRDFRTLGIEVVQYWSALVYRGPLAAAIIQQELPPEEYVSLSTAGRAGAAAH
ncbi:MAG: hypothetical protein MUE40_07855 [Anaerolineae bacterium]|nr:hypothetical protein [Anaerolineae bacterium]